MGKSPQATKELIQVVPAKNLAMNPAAIGTTSLIARPAPESLRRANSLPDMSKTHSLIREPFHTFTSSLACHIGVDAAIVLQRIAFLLATPHSGQEIDGERWIWNTMNVWHREFFPFWSLRKVESIFASLEKSKVLMTCQPSGTDRTKRYRINEGAYELLTTEAAELHSAEMVQSTPQNLRNANRAEETDRRDIKDKGCFSDEKALTPMASFPYPKTEDEMYETLASHGIEPNPDFDGNFFNQMSKAEWTISGKKIHNWILVYTARLERTSPTKKTSTLRTP